MKGIVDSNCLLGRAILVVAVAGVVGCVDNSRDAAASDALAEWTVESQPLTTIGELEGDPAYIFSGIAAVRLLPDGRVLVADRASSTVRIFGLDGRFQLQAGRSGQGPGEFEYISDVFVLPPDTIAVYDSQAFRLTKILTDGHVAAAVSFHAPDGNPEVYLGQYADGSHGMAWIKQAPRDPSSIGADIMQIARFEADGRSATLLGTDLGMRRLRSPLPFSPHFLAVMVGDTVLHTDGVGGEVRATGPTGESLRTLRVATNAPDLDAATQSLAAALDSAGARRLEDIESNPGTDTVPAISDLLTDDRGLLWLKRYEPATDSHWVLRRRTGGDWLVVRTDGATVATVSMPDGVRLMDVGDDRVAGVAEDSLGVERVQVFRLRRGPPAP